jgi:hypothetical protein
VFHIIELWKVLFELFLKFYLRVRQRHLCCHLEEVTEVEGRVKSDPSQMMSQKKSRKNEILSKELVRDA